MPDLLVRLYDLDSFRLPREIPGYQIRRASSIELERVSEWVGQTFNAYWRSETIKSFSNTPVTCIVAKKGNELCGFAVYETTARGYFGPTGIHFSHRGAGLGKALMYHALKGLLCLGYGYAIIGWTDNIEFYKKTVDALVIPNSDPGIYPQEYRNNT